MRGTSTTRQTITKYTPSRRQEPRRTRIPDRPNKSANLWSVAKNFAGKDLAKVSLPVNFNEPLSFLQRLTEDFEYAELLDLAADSDNGMQIAYVAAFAISSYSSTVERVGKPFNPLLGETYECDRTDDLGWKCISEQVSHHPPISAIHCVGKKWKVWQQFTMDSKFRGKYIRVVPIGIVHLLFPASGNHFTWNKVETTVNNVILGNLWIDQTGTMIIKNHKTGWQSDIEFIPYNYYNKEEQRSIKGVIKNDKGEVKLILTGCWNDKLKVSAIYKTDIAQVIWERSPLLPDSKNYYYFSLFACQLNEMEPNVAPTDSRKRPDQRLMEEGKWEQANALKTALEEKQRSKRRDSNEFNPLWFELGKDTVTGEPLYIYKGTYWDCKDKQHWSKCPNLFDLSVD
ncbi:hypothetical protein O3M35_013014 [Rhynocoris fuscipes]|uniref:Oxysterol-binding protein n=1 Tax=Rhynocoris fuscipes TaxID=488301 RepID=A0AAW1CF14_9HEMI